MNDRVGAWTYEQEDSDRNVGVWTRAVLVNQQPAVFEIRFSFYTKLGMYTIRLARSGVVVAQEGGLEWDDLNRVMPKSAWVLGDAEVVRRCGICGGQLWQLPLRGRRPAEGVGMVQFVAHLCRDCGQVWESEITRL